MGVRDYTAKEVLNKVLYNNTSLRTYTLSEGLNTILDAGNNRLKVNLQGGVIDGDVIVTGTLEVQGATTTIKSETILVTDKTFELAVPSSGSASDANSDGGGIILRGSTNKSILWNNANDWWNFNQGINVTGNAVFSGNVTGTFIGNVTGNVSGTAPAGTLTGATLANGVTASSLTSVGTLTSLTVSGAPFVISNTNNGNNIDIKTTSSGSLVHAVKIHSGGLFEAKQGVSSTTGTFTGNVLLMGADSYARDLTFRHGTANPNHYWRMGYTATGNGNTLAFINRDGGAEQEVMRMDYNKLATFAGHVTVSDRVVGSGDLVLVTTDSNEKIHMDSDGYIKFETAGSERMRIDSAGRVGIANDAPGDFDGGSDDLVIGNSSGNRGLTIRSGSSNSGTISFSDGTTGDQAYRGAVAYDHNSDSLSFKTSATARAMIRTGLSIKGAFVNSVDNNPDSYQISFGGADTANPRWGFRVSDGSDGEHLYLDRNLNVSGRANALKIDKANGNSTFAGYITATRFSGVGSDLLITSGANAVVTIDAGNAGVQLSDLAKVGGPTGDWKGAGTLNAVGVYDDGSLLSCYVFDQAVDGAIDNKKWDDKVLDRPKGTDGKSDYEARSHQDMRKFKERIGTDTDPLDIDKYSKHWKDKKHLTSMPNEEKFNLEEGMTVGSWVQRLIETVEIQAVHISNLNDRIKALENA